MPKSIGVIPSRVFFPASLKCKRCANNRDTKSRFRWRTYLNHRGEVFFSISNPLATFNRFSNFFGLMKTNRSCIRLLISFGLVYDEH